MGWQCRCEWRRASPGLHVHNKPFACFIGCANSRVNKNIYMIKHLILKKCNWNLYIYHETVNTLNPVLNGKLRNRQNKGLNEGRKYCRMLEHFWPALSNNWSWKPIFCLFEKGLFTLVLLYSKTCVKQSLKIDKTNILMTNGSLMKVESIAECSPCPWSILQYFWPAFSGSWSWKPTFGLFESGRFTQALLHCIRNAFGCHPLWITPIFHEYPKNEIHFWRLQL